MFDSALPLAEQGGKSALAAEAPDDPRGGIRFLVHGTHNNEFFVIMQVRANEKATGRHRRLCRVVMARVIPTCATFLG
ncbi:MAG: hypothetical protein OJF49_002020 [Ktedonobacterales bacterium]|nr:MAG: hypothetical protein OJF49_002020 [Ktedonobacterales bacterium]